MEDRCVCCGEIIPEGVQVCPKCLVASKYQPKHGTGRHKMKKWVKWLFAILYELTVGTVAFLIVKYVAENG